VKLPLAPDTPISAISTLERAPSLISISPLPPFMSVFT